MTGESKLENNFIPQEICFDHLPQTKGLRLVKPTISLLLTHYKQFLSMYIKRGGILFFKAPKPKGDHRRLTA